MRNGEDSAKNRQYIPKMCRCGKAVARIAKRIVFSESSLNFGPEAPGINRRAAK
jgi:hypothetical protein